MPPRALLALALLLTPALAQLPGPGISHDLAIARAARLSDLRYDLAFTLIPKSPTTKGRETLTFALAPGPQQDLPIDFRDGTIQSASLNTRAVPTALDSGHLILPAAALHPGPNTLTVAFTANIAPAGKAITRYLDKDDGNEYLYTLFVPMDADMAFPCFDQPDLKARFTLHVITPFDWAVISNVEGVHLTFDEAPGPLLNHFHFPETRPISTYLFAFAAGPFARIPPTHPGEPALYVRKSQLPKALLEAPAVQSITARGVAYLTDYFAQPFPFPKYDLVLIPGFPFGGMEHAGATFLNEDGVLFRSTPTASDLFRRDVLILHETTHQWFGDLVTMRWFDDLWLKEGFAQYMAYKAMAQLKPETNPWKHFAEDIKPLAYAIDETEGTTPIFQTIPNLKDAKSAYGAIVYQKAPSILKQLEFKLDDQTFRNGLRLYLKQHAYANAQWADLIHAFTQAGGKDVQPWADAYVLHRGMPQIDSAFTCTAGKLTTLTLTQKDVLGTPQTWPLANEVRLFFPPPIASRTANGNYKAISASYRIQWSSPSIAVKEALGAQCPVYVFANSGDQAYGRFLLDPTSQKAVTSLLAESRTTSNPESSPDPLLRSQLWSALWENVRLAKSSPASYVELALTTLPAEPDEALNRIQGARIALALHAWMSPKGREAFVPRAEDLTRSRMMQAPDLGLRIVNFRTFTSLAETPSARQTLKDLLAGKTNIPGMPLKPLDRYNILTRLIALADPEAPTLLTAELAHDHSGESQKYAYAAQAASPDPATKSRYFADYLNAEGKTSATIQEDWLTQSLRPFNSLNQSPLTLPFLARALDALPGIKAHRKIFFLGAWLAAFLDGQTSPEAQQIVYTWLAHSLSGPNLDPDLRLKVLETSEALDRTILIRQTYPN